MTENEKRLAGLWHDANNDEEMIKKRKAVKNLCFAFNHTKDNQAIKKKLLPHAHPSLELLAPFYCDYGDNIEIGAHCFINHDAYFMDGAKITIHDHCFIGPRCGIYTVNHPIDPTLRNTGLEIASPVTIKENVWIGADVSILAGVTIGKNVTIGAKSLVIKDIPDNCVAAGNPCKILYTIEKDV